MRNGIDRKAAEAYLREIESNAKLARMHLSGNNFESAALDFDAITTAAQKALAEVTPYQETTHG